MSAFYFVFDLLCAVVDNALHEDWGDDDGPDCD